MNTVDAITFTIAVLGAVLGVIGTWHQLGQSRVKLRVVPKLAFMVPGNGAIRGERITPTIEALIAQRHPVRLCIEVVNLSAFAVTVSDVGFGRTDTRRHCLIQPDTGEGKTFPTRLESREAVSLYAAIGQNLNPEIMTTAVAYAETDCGMVRYGTSSIFRKYVRWLRQDLASKRLAA